MFGLMQQVYHRALYSLGPDVGCYAPPKLYENELKESLQVREKTTLMKYSIVSLLFSSLLDSRIGVTQLRMLTELYTFVIKELILKRNKLNNQAKSVILR